MKLFLASQAGRTIDLFNKEFFSLKNKKVAFIANAADIYDKKPWIYFDKMRLKDYGAQIVDIDLRKLKGKNLYKKLSNIDVIFVSGGNTFYLLEIMKKSGFDKIIKKLLAKGIVYVGSSAGSCVAAPDVTPIKLLDDFRVKPLKSYIALNLTKFLALSHINRKKYMPKCLDIKKIYDKKYNLITLRDDQVLIVNGNEYAVKNSNINLSLIKSVIFYKIKNTF